MSAKGFDSYNYAYLNMFITEGGNLEKKRVIDRQVRTRST